VVLILLYVETKNVIVINTVFHSDLLLLLSSCKCSFNNPNLAHEVSVVVV